MATGVGTAEDQRGSGETLARVEYAYAISTV
jgi:hypothetical protein